MAGVIGPNRYRPGQVLKAAPGVFCDQHKGILSVARVVGETDSFGSEVIDVCQKCLDKINNKKTVIGECELCHTTTTISRRRDPAEGYSGRLYDMCDECNARLIKNF